MEPMNQSEQRRVVITGMGVIAPNGQDLASFWHTVRDGVSAADRLTRFEAAHLPTRIAAQIEKFDAGRYMDAKKRRRLDLHIQYGLAASRCALSDAGIEIGCLDAERIGIIEGASTSGLESAFCMPQVYRNRGYQRN
jgi:3-oxoacyl-[acyl-carrier-protein] synthase II